MTTAECRARASYLEARVRFEIAAAKADLAFLRWFRKRERGERTNGAQATRLANEANYLSADLVGAEDPLWSLDVEPETVWSSATGREES